MINEALKPWTREVSEQEWNRIWNKYPQCDNHTPEMVCPYCYTEQATSYPKKRAASR